jgi:AraC family transcriptional regulator of adaptative response/methylated-DNA-[protein]-cysteine methyltransferase
MAPVFGIGQDAAMSTLTPPRVSTPGPTWDDARRWQAVLNRDVTAAPVFVYAVRTTGVYCRPGCGSRRPRRESVVFFATPAQAGAAGYRACRRCRPDHEVAWLSPAERVRRACATIESADERPRLDELAAAAGLSRFHFHRLFKQILGVTPREYAAARSLSRLKAELEGGASVTRAIVDAGFGSSSRVYEMTQATLGMTPGAYRSGAPGVRIAYAVVECRLGWLLVAATPRGVCSIELGSRPEPLARRLRGRFPKAHVVEDGAELAQWVRAVTRFLDAPVANLDLPLDVQGTAFQRRVWSELRKIPVGTTLTYGRLAQRVGRPRAVRAVARACATNSIALAIPCHRVIGTDGDLSGYRWGLARKRLLLERERTTARRR